MGWAVIMAAGALRRSATSGGVCCEVGDSNGSARYVIHPIKRATWAGCAGPHKLKRKAGKDAVLCEFLSLLLNIWILIVAFRGMKNTNVQGMSYAQFVCCTPWK